MAGILKPGDISTEQKILDAAAKVFTQKGFAATRTRDIAEAAGINLALLNYYFRSKEKLFQKVMMEKIQQMFSVVVPILMNAELSLDDKIDTVTNKYLDFLSENPNLPVFILSELQNDSSEVIKVLPLDQVLNNNPVMFHQINERKPGINPMHIIINFISMTVFPFAAKNVLEKFNVVPKEEFQNFIEERRKLIPIWIKTLLNSK